MYKKRNPFIAFLLGLLPPLGQIYNGQFKKGLILWLSFFVIFFSMIALKVLHTIHGLVIFNAIYILFWIFMIIDAVINAQRQKEYQLKRYNRWYYYIAVWILVLALYPVYNFLAFRVINTTRAFYVRTPSMMHTILRGDNLVADMSYYRNNKPGRGDIVVYLSPVDAGGKTHIHRCVAVEGDFFEIKDGSVFVNGKRSVEPYAWGETDYSMFKKNNSLTGIVPAGHVVILGDNRRNCMDSRYYGYLPVDKLIGRALYIYYSGEKGFTAKYLYR